ncbi:class I SAM-dependent methyltransferase [Magnetospirillum moscoviense]|uniref:Methyltransferase n=1 Tax=Magnetospirillum moscoviense TaxID=1437059 RepID=A0A178MWY3_9PROT|nr:SAM-dependent methyltransferase [Magnetospirillum moscoviense]MBF0325261.1 SAM-dependent methyltransferase [Alphaproteobacteria bacterium]OAN53986.1 methyltransferase [Magnetospirillum moscoviense]
MASLTALLAERIRLGGPVAVADFMAEALFHPELGYYTSREPFGAQGDFTTAPEISQMFGEMIGLWAIVAWQMLGSPERLVFVELGPGRGTLMSDMLRTIANVGACRAALEIWLVEASPRLAARQAQTLVGHDIHWAERFDDLPDGPMVLVANELFDALPIRQHVHHQGRWHERMVNLEAPGFAFTAGPHSRPDLPDALLDDAPDGAIAETCPAGRTLAAAIGARIARQPGLALVIDYGHPRSALGETLQAVSRHRFHPVLEAPGSADLTAHVDFEALAQAAMPARAWGTVTQGEFLKRLGIETRAALLAQAGGPKVSADIAGQLRRLIDSDEMGTLFKVLALAHPALPAPPGFVG